MVTVSNSERHQRYTIPSNENIDDAGFETSVSCTVRPADVSGTNAVLPFWTVPEIDPIRKF